MGNKYNQLKVLMVADSKTMVYIIRDLMVSLGISPNNFMSVPKASDALEIMNSVQLDLVITNLWLPPLYNGLELLDQIRHHTSPSICELPVVFITGEISEDYKKQALDGGANGYLTKPFKMEVLKQTIHKIFPYGKGEATNSDLNTGKNLAETKEFEGKKILLVDDSPTNISILKNVLQGQGFVFLEAPSGELALKMLYGSLPDLIIMDVVMTGIDGFETTRQIKKNPQLQGVPVIFVTGENNSHDLIEGFEAGGVDYITKPFIPEEVRLRVQNQIRLQVALSDKEHMIRELIEVKEKKELLIDELLTLKEKLELNAVTDPLTSLLNRRGITEKLTKEQMNFDRNQNGFSLILCDIDHFKNVNDTYGHEAGDHILVKTGQVLKQALRKADRVSRWGGEEFLVLLPATELETGVEIAETMRQNLASQLFHHEEKKLQVTMSLGVSYFNGKMDIKECIRQADQLLYQAKEQGRNRVVSQLTHC